MNGETSERIAEIQSHLVSVGYHREFGQLVTNYPYMTPHGLRRSALMAFGHPQIKDISTSCFAVEDCVSSEFDYSLFESLIYVGVPEAGIVFEDRFEHWSLVGNRQQTPQRLASVNYTELPSYLSEQRERLKPSALLLAKAHQPSFFDLDRSLIQFAREHTQQTLIQRFRETYNQSLEVFEDRLKSQYSNIGSTELLNLLKSKRKLFDQVSIDVLAICILKDKLREQSRFPSLLTDDFSALLQAVTSYFPAYFDDTKGVVNTLDAWDIAQFQFDALRLNFTFDSFTNDVLADFYEKTLVAAYPEIQRELGIYYTPRHITDQILQRLPIEHLPPDKRTVLDGTCGSGNMLLSAHERLSNILPANYTLQQRHNYLVGKIWGVDKDPLACKVARLSLLTQSLPAGDSWQIRDGSIFDAEPTDTKWFGQNPHIIVSNPPFRRKTSDGRQGYEQAADVIERYMDWLPVDGLLGIVMPASFLTATRGNLSETRKKFLHLFDVLELWQLPQGAFKSSDVPTCIILARKLPTNKTAIQRQLTRIRKVESYDLTKFQETKVATFEYLYDQHKWLSNNNQEMTCSHLEAIWEQMRSAFESLEPAACIIRKGIDPGKKANQEFFNDTQLSSDWKPCLRVNERTGNALEPYRIDHSRQTVRRTKPTKYMKYVAPYTDIHNHRTPSHFAEPEKIVINAFKQANNPWRIYGGIDRAKLLIIKTFHYVLPRQGITAEIIAALLNSMVANAWYASHYYQKEVVLNTLKKLPFPSFNQTQGDKLAALVREIEGLKQEVKRDQKLIRTKVAEIDNVVFEAYQLNFEQQQQIKQWMTYHHERPGPEWKDFDWGTTSPSAPVSDYPWWHPTWRFVAEVEKVDVENQQISLWIEHDDSVITIDIPSNMPGWALRDGVAFRASIPKEQRYPDDYSSLDWLKFEALDFGYLTEDEMLDVLEGQTSLTYE